MIESEVTLLPQPDSPTSPSVFPSSISKLTPSIARTSPSGVKNDVRRPLTWINLPIERFDRSLSARCRLTQSGMRQSKHHLMKNCDVEFYCSISLRQENTPDLTCTLKLMSR